MVRKSYSDFGLLLSPFKLEIPEIQTNYIDIVGRDGNVDLTEVLGMVNYKSRELELTFTVPFELSEVVRNYHVLANFLHGQKMKIILPTFESLYLIGRCSIGDLDRSKKTEQITITANCEPYKYKQNITKVVKTIGALPYEVVINSLKMPTTPTIITTNNVIMNFENADYSFAEGEHLNTSIVLKEGRNIFTFKEGSEGLVTFSYQEGML